MLFPAECLQGVWLEFLHPYLPDLNPIKEAFSKIKAFICQNSNIFLALLCGGIMFDMLKAMAIIMAEDAKGYFTHAGYQDTIDMMQNAT